jgi:hypothetical protein
LRWHCNPHAHERKLLLLHFLLNPVHLALITAEGNQQFTLTLNVMWYFLTVSLLSVVHRWCWMFTFPPLSFIPLLLVRCKLSVHHSFWGLHVIVTTTTTRYISLKWYSGDSRRLRLCKVFLHLQHGQFDLNEIHVFENNLLLSCMW